MTIDSAYQLELYNPDNDREYFFEFESIGATTFVLWVDYVFDGVAYRDSPGTFAYEIEFEGRGPIYKRGKITLTDDFFTALAGAKITRLTMQRKTPIFKDVTFEASGEWSSEGFEFEIDKICLIQQEIEGHYCDCREQEQGLDPIEEKAEEEYYTENPECEPYSCEAFKVAAAAHGEYYWPADNDPDVDGYLKGTVNINVNPSSYTLMSSPWFSSGCEGFKYWRNDAASIITIKAETSIYHPVIIESSYNVFVRTKRRNGVGQVIFEFILYYINQAKTQKMSHEVNLRFIDSETVRLSANTLSGGNDSVDIAWPNDGQPHVIGVSIDSPDSFTGAVRPVGYDVYIDGDLVSSGSFSIGTAGGNPGTTWNFSSDDNLEQMDIGGGEFSDFVINGNVEKINLSAKRNMSSYTPPDWCVFPQG